jgi:hypothetical protein
VKHAEPSGLTYNESISGLMNFLFLAPLLLMPAIPLRPVGDISESQSTDQTEQELRKLTNEMLKDLPGRYRSRF